MSEYELFVTRMKSMPSFLYYTNNQEYRDAIRRVFQMNPNEVAPYADLSLNEIDTEEMDMESKDEMQYDMKQMDIYLTEVFENTKHERKFMDLYKNAAKHMLSEDPLIGQVVLCSYDFFHLYFSCLWFYFHGGRTSLVGSSEYEQLVNLVK